MQRKQWTFDPPACVVSIEAKAGVAWRTVEA